MTLLAPGFLWAAAAASAMVAVLHLLAWRRPPATVLPTARFVPDAPVRLASRAIRPSDLLLLLARVLALLLAGLALAGPVPTTRRSGVGRIAIVDASRAVGDRAARDRIVGEWLGGGGTLVVFDSAVRVIDGSADTLASLPPRGVGSLSGALAAAAREATRLRRTHDTVRVLVAATFAREQVDEATASLRALIPEAVELRQLDLARATNVAEARRAAATDDALGAALALAVPSDSSFARVVRGVPSAGDSAWARAGGALVVWPAEGRLPGWSPAPETTSLALVVGDEAFVGPVSRVASPPEGRVVARWPDGSPAATETSLGDGCVRSVAARVPEAGDAVLAPSFQRVLERLASPCGARVFERLPDSLVQRFAAAPAAAAGVRVEGELQPPRALVLALLGAALLLFAAEPLLRRTPA